MFNYHIAERNIKQIISKSKTTHVLQNVIDSLYEHFPKYSWIGIYLIEGKELILVSWRGKQATQHTKIPIGKGICGVAAQSGKTAVVSDVSKDKRYLACFVSTRSEIVVPIWRNETVVGEIDIDSDVSNAFDDQDVVFLEKVADMLSGHIR